MLADPAAFDAFRVLVEHARDATLVVDRHLRVRYASPALQRVFGHPVASVQGTWLGDLLVPEDRERVLDGCRGVAASGAPRLDLTAQLRHADGTWRAVDVDVRHCAGRPTGWRRRHAWRSTAAW